MGMTDIVNSKGTVVGQQSVDDTPPVGTYEENITYRELVQLFPLDKWVEVHSLLELNATGRQIVSALKDYGIFNIKDSDVIKLLNAIQTNTNMTAAEITEIKKGRPL